MTAPSAVSNSSCNTIREWTQHHFVVLRYKSIRVDWLKSNLPIYRSILDRASTHSWQGRSLRVVSIEGLILLKLLASRPQDLADIDALVDTEESVDREWIESQWLTVADSNDERIEWLRRRLARN